MAHRKKAVIVTGAAGGIGRALLKKFSEANYVTIGLMRSKKTVPDCSALLVSDLERLVHDEAEYQRLKSELGTLLELLDAELSCLVNNAATQRLGSLNQISVADFRAVLDVNLIAPFALCKMCAPWLSMSHGAIVNIGSIHSSLTKKYFTSYACSKAGLVGLTQSLALELGGDVTVNVIQPAATKTDMLMDGFRDKPEAYKELEAYHPVGRIANSSEVADMAVYLASDKARFITGAKINMDGGIGVRLHDPG